MPGVRKVKAKDIRYLAFEGGGGKGVAYLGAIRELEKRITKPLVIVPNDAQQPNQIRGLSGASAGAITAFFLSMGYTSDHIEGKLNKGGEFKKFFDVIMESTCRSVIGNAKQWRGMLTERNPRQEILRKKLFGSGLIKGITVSGVDTFLGIFLAAELGGDPIVRRISSAPYKYLESLLFERGLFPGIAVRDYFRSQIVEFIKDVKASKYQPKSPRARRTIGQNGSNLSYNTLTFAVLEDISNVKLAITGANITTKRPEYFSSDFTPDFPVGEAVGISMNLPFLFKPVSVDYDIRGDGIGRTRYKGRWIDGGILNNLPIHYFDDLPALRNNAKKLPEPDYSKPLNKNMLALRLTPGRKPLNLLPGFNPGNVIHAASVIGSGREQILDTLTGHLSDIADTTLYPSEGGQIRTPQESAQTIDLYTYDLETTNFAPDKDKKRIPIDEARLSVETYFKEAEAEKLD